MSNKNSVSNKNKHVEAEHNMRSILLIILCTIFTSLGQILWKYSTSGLDSIYSIITNVPLIAGFISYGIGAILLIFSLKKANLSIVYPFIALSFIWVSIASIMLFGESMHLFNWLGIFSIIIGVSLIGVGSRK